MWRLAWFAHALAHVAVPPLRRQHLLSRAADADAIRRDARRGRSSPRRCSGPACRRCSCTTCCCSARSSRRRVAMFVLARYLTGSRAAGVIAGIVFAFAPYRFEHYMHMELQWTMWMPLAFLGAAPHARHRQRGATALAHRRCSSRCRCCRASTTASSSRPCSASARCCCCLAAGEGALWPSVRALAPGAVLAALLCGAYATPYLETKSRDRRAAGGRAASPSARGHRATSSRRRTT